MRKTNKYIPIARRTDRGELGFPEMRSKPNALVIEDLKKQETYTVNAYSSNMAKLTKSQRKLIEKLGTTGDYERIRYNLSYEELLDYVGTSLPFHPEYMYIINKVLDYYNVRMTEILENSVLTSDFSVNTSRRRKTVNAKIYACRRMLTYILAVQYNWNINTISEVIGTPLNKIQEEIEFVNRDIQNTVAVSADYVNICNELKKLETLKF